MPLPFVNIAAYKFISIDDGAALRATCLSLCTALAIKGTILLAPEGVNLFLAGTAPAIATFLEWLRADLRFADIAVKQSWSQQPPFDKILVKLKTEIITMKMPLIRPEAGRAPAVASATLKRWLDQGHDDSGKPVVMLDTRNAFETAIGTFDNAVELSINKFSEFPTHVARYRDALAGHTVVTFCTGGIRCEKAAIHMQQAGFDSVYQLDGGILKYFEEVGGAHYGGDCFVFDHRAALNPALAPHVGARCVACSEPVTLHQQRPGDCPASLHCPNCPQNGTD